jgi:hypothetical protein
VAAAVVFQTERRRAAPYRPSLRLMPARPSNSARGQRPGASGRQTIEGGVTRVRGKNPEPATSARTKPGPSARALIMTAGAVFWHAELRVCRADAPGGWTLQRCEKCSNTPGPGADPRPCRAW